MATTSTRRTPTEQRTSSIIGYYQRNPERTAMSAGECDDPWSYLSSVWMASLVCLILILGSFDQHTSPGTALPEGRGRLYVEKRLPCHRYNGFKRGRGPAPSTLVDDPHIITLVPARNACGKNQFSARISSDLGVKHPAARAHTTRCRARKVYV